MLWLWILAISNLVYWTIFIFLAVRHRPQLSALTVGVLHMLFAAPLVVAPIRSLLDPRYVGYSLGLLRFEGRTAVLPAAIILAWALATAWSVVAKRGRGPLVSVLVGDLFWVANFGIAFAMDFARGEFDEIKIQGGEFFTISGTAAFLLLFVIFVVPFGASAFWAFRQLRKSPKMGVIKAAHSGSAVL
ncbi:MAG: hypothetical protein L0Z53_13695 [Acidobacteriales bacterium]|nr:hypothetical protein [Terriglobales bacterium]